MDRYNTQSFWVGTATTAKSVGQSRDQHEGMGPSLKSGFSINRHRFSTDQMHMYKKVRHFWKEDLPACSGYSFCGT